MKNRPNGGGATPVELLGGLGVKLSTAMAFCTAMLLWLFARGGETKEGQLAPKLCGPPPPVRANVRGAKVCGDLLLLSMALEDGLLGGTTHRDAEAPRWGGAQRFVRMAFPGGKFFRFWGPSRYALHPLRPARGARAARCNSEAGSPIGLADPKPRD